MGGKAKRRREKNYLAAHGGGSARLPPPPEASTIDVVPSKLRKIMSFIGGKEKEAVNGGRKKSSDFEKRQVSKDEVEDKSDKIKKNNGVFMTNDPDNVYDDPDNVYDDITLMDTQEKKKKKRKRNQVKDLRFEESDKLVGTGSKRKERRKLRNEERKKKRKGNTLDFNSLNHDIVKFGDVVEAPPKLSFAPKTSNGSQDVSKQKLPREDVSKQKLPNEDVFKQRLRLKAIQEYRDKKKWTSRPGLEINPSLF